MSEHLYDSYFTDIKHERHKKEIVLYDTPILGVPKLDTNLRAYIKNARELITYDEYDEWREERKSIGNTGFIEELQDKTVVNISLYKHKDKDCYSLFIECEDESWIVIDI